MKIFFFLIPLNELEKIGRFKAYDHQIEFSDIPLKRATSRFNLLIDKNISTLRSISTENSVEFIHRGSGIPLIGCAGIGIVDRGSNIIEVKPITGCNLSCIYCSVDEGPTSKKNKDFVIDKDYLVEELTKMLTIKGGKGIEININPHGEPLLYSDLVDLVKDINKIKLVERVSIDTNGLLLNKDLLIELKDAGLTHINLSLNSLDSENAIKIAGSKTYSLKKILSIVKDIIHSGIKLNIAPVIMKDINDKNQLKDLVHLAKDSGASLSAQNFLKYRRGRNPVKEKSWEEFYSELEGLEKKFGTKLILKKEDFDIFKSKELPKPFKKGDVVKVKVVAEGRYPSEMICSAKERAITVRTKKDVGKMMTIKITRSKHNIFFGEET